jgi:EAL domain-containing protein (putative c-di-GMP-specific phosphodiesterase class I)/signal transduction histidine kinase/DNA-binding response OmpR family regulator
MPDISESSNLNKSKQALQDEVEDLRQQLSGYEASDEARVKQLASLSSALQESEKRYDSLFSQLPRGLQEEDYSLVKKEIDRLQAEGVKNLYQYFRNNPEFLRGLVELIEITKVNDALLEMHQADSLQKYLEGEDNIDRWWSDDWAEFYAAEFAALASPPGIYADERIDTRIDGSVFDISLITSIVRGSEQSWDRVITISEEVTERNRNQAALVEAKTMAEKASKAKTEFLSSMSHELRTPLNAILGFSQLFEYDKSLSERRRSNARAIKSAGQHLLKLIDEILDLSRIETGNIDISMEAVSLEAAINDSISWVTDMAENRKVNINFDASTCRGLMVEADVIRLKQVFLNLMTNAVKYNREGGSVNIVCTPNRNDCIRISFIDTGPGIQAERLTQLFKPFNRLGAEFSGVEGTGIGLVITRQLVQLMQGELRVESKFGEGSTFTVQFQLVQSNQVDIDVSSGGVESDDQTIATLITPKPCILVAEDNPVNRQLIAAQLKMLDYSADYAENGVEALKLWKTGSYRLLLTDIRMPEMDGYELMRQIRALESKISENPIIAVTANAMAGEVQKCLDRGANDVLSKPFGLEDLRQMLEKWSVQQLKPVAAHGLPTEVVDLSILRESVGDRIEVHRQLLMSYINALPEALDDIQQTLGWHNHQHLGEYAHKLKSSSISIGATQLGNICHTLEIACGEDREADINALVPQLLQAAEPVVAFVAAFCGEPVAEIVDEIPAAANHITSSQVSVLVVDDDYIMHRVTTIILNDLGIRQVYTALSGRQALEILEEKQNAIDIVICDLNMPEMDGVEFTRHLARQNYTGSLIISSGEDIRILKTVEKLAIEHELQVLGILEKPVTQAKLSRLLDTYDQVINEGTLLSTELLSADELLYAIEHDQLETYFQPKVDVKTQQVIGVEALVRWQHPLKGVISPNAFIPMAEEHGLIFELTLEVCRKALQHAAAWQVQGIQLDMALNISVDALNDLDWPDVMAAMVEASGLQPTSIIFEITESRLMEHLSVALDILSRLSLKRFKLSIDDFGTGYSSMEQLQRIPFSELKIDRAFVRGGSEDPSARAIMESSVLLAKKLGMKVVAEGVETEEDWKLVAQLGCDQVQGYYIARPMPADQFHKWLHKWRMPEARSLQEPSVNYP